MECIRTYFAVDRKDIRCTSVRPYRLPVGENTADRLRDEITEAEVVLGILTTDTLESSYVAFELGLPGDSVCGPVRFWLMEPIRVIFPTPSAAFRPYFCLMKENVFNC